MTLEKMRTKVDDEKYQLLEGRTPLQTEKDFSNSESTNQIMLPQKYHVEVRMAHSPPLTRHFDVRKTLHRELNRSTGWKYDDT